MRGAGGEREGGREGRLASPFWREGRQGLWGVEEELEGRQGLGGGEAELDAGSWVCATQSPTVSMRRHGVNLSPAQVRVRGDVATKLRPQAHNSCEHAVIKVFLLPVSNLEMLFASRSMTPPLLLLLLLLSSHFLAVPLDHLPGPYRGWFRRAALLPHLRGQRVGQRAFRPARGADHLHLPHLHLLQRIHKVRQAEGLVVVGGLDEAGGREGCSPLCC